MPAIGSTKNTLFQKLLRNAAAAGAGDATKLLNAWDRAAMASPPTITSSTTATVTGRQRTVIANPELFAQYGGVPLLYATNYKRYQAVTFGTGTTASGGNIQNDGSTNAYPGAQAAGFAIEFMADSIAPEIFMLGSSNYRLLVDDQYVSKTVQTYAGGGSRFLKCTLGARGVHRWRIEGEQGSGFGGVNVAATESVWLPDQGDLIKAVVFGDSFSASSGATCAHNGYAQVLGKLMGWRDVRQASIGSTGYVNAGSTWKFDAHVTDIGLHAPDILIIAGGKNDSGQATLQAEVLAFLTLARAQTSCPIIVLGSFAGSTGPDAGCAAAEAAIAAAVTQFADPYCAYVPVSPTASSDLSWIYGTGRTGATNASGNADLYVGGTDGTDTTHPPDAGHEYIARRAVGPILNQIKTWMAAG